MKKDRDCRIIRLGDRILRILDAEGEKALVIDCVKMGMPKWISLSEIEDGVEIPGEEFMGEMERDIPEGMSASARQTMHERFTVISGILPCVGDKKQRSLRIADAAEGQPEHGEELPGAVSGISGYLGAGTKGEAGTEGTDAG